MKRLVLPYTFALVFVAIVTAGCVALLPLGTLYAGTPDILFFLAIVAAALYTNTGASFTALAVSCVLLPAFIFPLYPGSSPAAVLALRTASFCVAGGVACLLAHATRKARAREARSQSIYSAEILGSISESFIVLDREWRFVYANHRVLEQTGKSWPELKGQVIWNAFPEAARTGFKSGYEKVMQERVPHNFEVTYPNPDGSVAHYQVHAYPASNGLSALISDVTAKKKIENELSESQRLLNLALDTAHVGTWIMNVDSGEIFDIGNTARLLGRERIATYSEFLQLLHPEDRSLVDKAMEEAKTTGRFDAEYRILLPGGQIGRMHGIGSIVRETMGKRMAGVLFDVTDRGRAEDARLRLAAIVDSSDDAIVSKDLNGVITSWNVSAMRLFGYTAEEMIGRSVLTIIPPELQSEEPSILAALRRGEKIEHYETERLCKNGDRVPVSLSISPVRDSRGDVIGASKIARNISERIRMQAAIIESEKLAATGRMAAAIAHEINNPLEAVMNLAFLLSTDPSLGHSAKRYASLLLDEIGRASQVARQSLGFFRDTSKPSEFLISELLDSVLRLNKPLIERKRIDVSREYRSDATIFGSPSELRQVLANLLRNAIEAIDEKGAIRLRIRTDSVGMQHILVADNGRGIPVETRRRLFEPFVTSKGATGNGLGLWVSRGIMRKHGGRIRVRTCTERGRSGTVFALILPASTAPVLSESATGLHHNMLN